jgi:Flp pilus assembly protein TadD
LPPTPESLLAAARVVAAQGRNSECEFLLTRIVREHPYYMPAYADLAELRMRQRQVGEAEKALEAGLKRSPRDAVLLNNMALCRMIEGDFEGALGAATQAVGVQPHNARYRANLATILGLMGRRDEALALYTQILPREDAYHNVSVLHGARGELLRTANSRRPGL